MKLLASRLLMAMVGCVFFSALAYSKLWGAPVNRVQTSREATDENLRSRQYRATFEEAENVVRFVTQNLQTYGKNWKFIGQNSTADDILQMNFEVPVLIFTDDFQVTLRELGENRVEINLQSQSRVGRADFGENRRHVQQFWHALDEQLTR